MNSVVVMALAVAAVAGCGGNPTTAPSTTQAKPELSSSASSAPPVAGSEAPRPSTLPAGTFQLKQDLGAGTVRVNGDPIGDIPLSGEHVTAFLVTIASDKGQVYVSPDEFEVPDPRGGTNRKLIDTYKSLPAEVTAIDKLCGDYSSVFDFSLDTAIFVDFGESVTACLPFSYADDEAPSRLILNSLGSTNASWPLRFMASPEPSPTVLATFSGYGSQLIALPAAVARAKTVKVAWNMPGRGNNIIELEDDTAGSGLTVLTNVLGVNINARAAYVTQNYAQVISDGDWTITITDH